SSWKTSQPSLTNAIASCGDLKRVNSSTSAPAMKFSFAERITRPLGCAAAIARSAPRSSSSAWREKVLADSPCLSKVSHASRSRSISQRQCFSSNCGSMRSIAPPLDRFDQHRAAQAAADADRGHAALFAGALQRLQQVQHDARAGRADRMAECDRAAIHVQPALIELAQRAVEPELFAAVLLILPRGEAAKHLRRKGFVDLPVVEIIEAEAVALEDRGRRVHRPEAHLCRIESRPLRIDDAPERLQAVLTQRLLVGEEQPGGAIGNLGAVAGSDVAVLAVKKGPKLGERLERCIGAHAIVEREGLAARLVERFDFA